MTACRVCGNEHPHRVHLVQEQFLGLKDKFEYLECGACRSLSIADIPVNMERYYPATYYSFTPVSYHGVAGVLRGRRDRYYLDGTGALGRVVSVFSKPPQYIDWLRNLELHPGARILDVGCGSGRLIVNLQDAGFPSVGIDRYVGGPVVYANGARVLRSHLKETQGEYDCIMLHHSLEHQDDPQEVFENMSRLLKHLGKALIRTPVAGTYAWRTYRENWYQLDAPRHFVVFSEKGIRRLAEQHGFRIVRTVYDSTASQFWGSEQYARSIASTEERSYAMNPERSLFSAAQVRAFSERAEQLNAAADGDQAAFYLVKDR